MKAIIQRVRRISKWAWGCFIVAALTIGLGLLQSHWLKELSERERESLQAHLTVDASRFGEDFDRELTRVYTTFQLDPEVIERHDGRAIAARYALWMTQTSYPHLVRSLWIAEPADDSSAPGPTTSWRFLRLDSQQNLLPAERPAAWLEPNATSPLLNPINEKTLTLFIPVISPTRIGRLVPAPISHTAIPGAIPAGVRLAIRFLVVQLDRQCITNELLPTLAMRYFHGPPGATELEYRVAVVGSEMPHELIYDSNHGSSGAVRTAADVTTSLFGIRRQLGGYTRASVSQLKRVDTAAVLTPARNLTTATAVGFAPEAWQLRVTHRLGSLEALATRTRWQNLVLSLTILVLLAGTVVLLLMTARRASSLARRQTEFVAGVSHELRTPMAVITMTAANLADGIVSDPANVRRYGIILQEEGRRLARMVEQVLSYARIQAKNLPPREPTHVNVLVCSVVKSMQPGMTELGFSCTLQLAESLPTVMIDRFSMECVIQNLLSNALKYSADQRAIRVSTGKEKSRAGLRVWIEVQDQGIGIEPDEQSAIFQPFRRGRAAMERSLPGSGLGLSLVERIVQAHGGTVRLRSEPRKGSTFTVSLPAVKSAAG